MIKSDGEVYVETNLNTDGIDKGLATAEKKISKFGASVKNLKSQIKNAFSKGFETNASQADMAELQSQIRKTEMQLDRLIEKQIRFVETGGDRKSRTFAGMEYDIEMARTKLQELQNTLASVSAKSPRHLGKFRSAVEQLIKSISNLNKKTKSAHGSLLKMLASSVLFSTVFRAINLVTQGFSDGINNLAQYSDETNASLSALKSSLTQLKNSFAAAFAPILSVVTPAITQFINLIAKASNIVAAFFAALSGKSTYTKAIEVQEDYRDSLEGTADAAKKAQKYLSGLDEIRTFTDNSAGEGTGVSPKDMFVDENISNPILDFADKVKAVIEKIKGFIKAEDWSGLGKYISDGIVSALKWITEKLDSFDWEGLGENIGEFLSGIDWIEVIKQGFKLKFNVWKAIAEVWFGSFKAAPIETAIITALAALKFTNLGSILAPKIVSAIFNSKLVTSMASAWASLGGIGGIFTSDIATVIGAGTLAEKGLLIGSGLIAGIVAAFAGFEFGKELGKYINPQDAEWYDNFKWFGEDGFFDIIAEDLGTTLDAIVRMANDFENNPVIAALTRVIGGPFVGLPANLALAKESFTQFKDFLTEWWEKDVAPYFTKEKWAKGMQGVKDAFNEVWTGAVNVAISLINKFIDCINEKMHFEWDAFKDPLFGTELFPAGSVQLFTIPKIPMLATGAVIPPNAPFMAVLGDQKHGTNIEAPLSTIEQALENVYKRNNGGGGESVIHNVIQVNRRTLYDEFIKEARLRQDFTGRNPFDLA